MPCFPLLASSAIVELDVVTVLSLDGSKRFRLGVASTSISGGTFSSSPPSTATVACATGLAHTSSSLKMTKPGSCIRPILLAVEDREDVDEDVELDGVGRAEEPRREPIGGLGARTPTLPFPPAGPAAPAELAALANPPLPLDEATPSPPAAFSESLEARLDAFGVASKSLRAGDLPVPSSSTSSSTMMRFGVAVAFGVAGRLRGSETGERGRFGSRT